MIKVLQSFCRENFYDRHKTSNIQSDKVSWKNTDQWKESAQNLFHYYAHAKGSFHIKVIYQNQLIQTGCNFFVSFGGKNERS